MTDVLIIGAGGAGLVAALSAKESGASVKVASKSYPTRSQTSMAQGGINAALANSGDDSVQDHIADTLRSAQLLASESAITALCTEGVDAVEWLDRIGVPFSRTKEGKIAQRRLGAASAERACHAQDYTGLKILHTLYDQCLGEGIEFMNEHFLLDLIIQKDDAGRSIVDGAMLLDIRTGEVQTHLAKSVILATGGYSRIYNKHSTNAIGTTGDGLAAALRAGARLSDMEFVQFHPTALEHSAILISESARGAGGHLLNAKKERFTDELATRDVVARAILAEIEKSGKVYLDIRHLGEAFIDEELPQERKLARLYEGVDPVHDLIPIRPVAHYTMGGIEVDADSQSNIAGLFAAGECANHNVHGANRLGGNSLLELIVFGRQAGRNAAQRAKARVQDVSTDERQSLKDQHYIDSLLGPTHEQDFYETRISLGDVFYEKVGLVREATGMQEALDVVLELKERVRVMGPKDKSRKYNTNLVEFIEFSNMVDLSESVVVSAIGREESRGAHFRSDRPERDDVRYAIHTLTWCDKGSVRTGLQEKE